MGQRESGHGDQQASTWLGAKGEFWLRGWGTGCVWGEGATHQGRDDTWCHGAAGWRASRAPLPAPAPRRGTRRRLYAAEFEWCRTSVWIIRSADRPFRTCTWHLARGVDRCGISVEITVSNFRSQGSGSDDTGDAALIPAFAVIVIHICITLVRTLEPPVCPNSLVPVSNLCIRHRPEDLPLPPVTLDSSWRGTMRFTFLEPRHQ